VRHHFIDSLTLAKVIDPLGRLLDVGSGAGFPGLPLKILFPQKEMLLLEPTRKKANFIRAVIRELGLKGVRVAEQRIEDLIPEKVLKFKEAVARAFGSYEEFFRVSYPHLDRDGKAIAMHGPSGETLFDELKHESALASYTRFELIKLKLPMGNENRILLVLTKN